MGDEIFIFGFSSGGLAALMLTQLIENVGIKKQETFYGSVEKYGQVEFASSLVREPVLGVFGGEERCTLEFGFLREI